MILQQHHGAWTWLDFADRPVRPRRPQSAGVVLRAALLSLAVALPAATFLPPPDRATAAAPAPSPPAPAAKAADRLARWNGPLASAAVHAAPPDPARFDPLAGSAAAPPTRFSAGPPAPSADTFQQVSRVEASWREEAFAGAVALDGRTLLLPDGRRLRLAGLTLPAPGASCRTLDGRAEPCATRAATVLDLTIRHRRLECRHRPDASGEAVGACRLGGADLAGRLLKAGDATRVTASI